MRGILIVLAAGLAFWAGNAAGEPLRLVTGDDYIPFTDKDLPDGGLITAIVRQAYERAGHDVSIEFLPWRRGAELVQSGERLATFPYVKTEARRAKFLYSDPIFVAEERPIVHERDAGSITTYADLKGKTLCMPVGWKSGDKRLMRMIDAGEIELVKPKTTDACLRMLESKRADTTMLGMMTARHKKNKDTGAARHIHIEELTLTRNTLHVVFSKKVAGAHSARKTFNTLLEKLQASGAYEKIVAQHLEAGTS